MESWLRMRDPLVAKVVPTICHMLLKTPVGADKEATALWKQMRRLSVEMFQKFWSRVDNNNSLMDLKDVAYSEW